MNTTLAAKVGGGVAILTGTGVGGTYIATKESVESKVKDVVLNSNSTEKDWEIAQKYFNTKENPKFHQSFKKLKEDLKSSTTENSLKKTCLSIYNESYGSAFSKDEELVNQVKEYCTKAKAIWYEVKDDVLPNNLTNNDTVWKKAQDKLKDATEQTNQLIKDLKDLQDELKVDSTPAKGTKGELLKNKCEEIYYKVITEGAEKTKWVNQTKKYCFLAIKEMLEESKKLKDFDNTTEDTEWDKKVTALNDYSESTELKLNEKLTTIKAVTESGESKNRRTELKKWCKDAYEKSYKGEKDGLFLLTKKFCTKEAAAG